MPTLNWIGKDKVVNHHLDYIEKQDKYGITTEDSNQRH